MPQKVYTEIIVILKLFYFYKVISKYANTQYTTQYTVHFKNKNVFGAYAKSILPYFPKHAKRYKIVPILAHLWSNPKTSRC